MCYVQVSSLRLGLGTVSIVLENVDKVHGIACLIVWAVHMQCCDTWSSRKASALSVLLYVSTTSVCVVASGCGCKTLLVFG